MWSSRYLIYASTLVLTVVFIALAATNLHFLWGVLIFGALALLGTWNPVRLLFGALVLVHVSAYRGLRVEHRKLEGTW